MENCRNIKGNVRLDSYLCLLIILIKGSCILLGTQNFAWIKDCTFTLSESNQVSEPFFYQRKILKPFILFFLGGKYIR